MLPLHRGCSICGREVRFSESEIKLTRRRAVLVIRPSSRHADRVPIPPIKTLISQLGTRTSYGLDVSDIPAAIYGTTKRVTVPIGLQLWFWEVEDEGKWANELAEQLQEEKKQRSQVSP